jgi:hypothetical protein
MALYTFFLEYGGGTYISQVEAVDHEEAAKEWAIRFDLHSSPDYRGFFEDNFGEKLMNSLDLNLVTTITGVINTWSWGAYRLEKPATIHFTKTDRH